MQVVRHGALSGKARINHKRNRAARLYADHLVEEYFEPNPVDPGHDRYIPVRGRSDFHPSVAFSQATGSAETERQLVLPLKGKAEEGKRSKPIDTRPKTPQRETGPTADIALRFPRSRKSTASPILKPPQQFRRKEKFTIGGFLFGCVMGSAAAALVLLVVQIVVG